MKAEIISIGTELLLGQIINTNAAFFAKELQELGIDSYYQTTVGDNINRIHTVLSQALQRTNLILTTGGLGPTSDDLTHEAISSFFKVKLVIDKKTISEIEKKFILRGYKKMPEINIKQAYKPKDAKWIPNKHGTAKGIIWEVNDVLIMTFPGVPSELIQMWNDTAKPYLKRFSTDHIIYSKTLKFTGIGESALAEKISSYFNLKNPTVAPYASLGEVKIRITSKAKNLTSAKNLVKPILNKILTKTKKYYWGEDDQTLENIVGDLLKSEGETIGIAESCTGGLLSKRLTDIPGSSKYIKLNVITYANRAKNKLFHIEKNILDQYGAVSSQIASRMAVGIKDLSESNIGFSITGIAGPDGGRKDKPVGLVYFGLATNKRTITKKVLFGRNLTRSEIRWLATQFALNWIRKELI